MADEAKELQPAPETAPEGVPSPEGTAPEGVSAEAKATAPTELPADWDADPKFRELKSWAQRQTDKAVKEAVAAVNVQWAGWANEAQKQIEAYQTEKLTPEQLASYHEAKRTEERAQAAAQLQDLTLKMNVAAKYGIPLERVVSAQGVEGLLDAVAGYSNEKLVSLEERLAKLEKGPVQRQLVKPTSPAAAPVEPPKVAGGGTTTAPKGATAEFFSLTPEERKKILRNPRLAQELWDRAGSEKS